MAKGVDHREGSQEPPRDRITNIGWPYITDKIPGDEGTSITHGFIGKGRVADAGVDPAVQALLDRFRGLDQLTTTPDHDLWARYRGEGVRGTGKGKHILENLQEQIPWKENELLRLEDIQEIPKESRRSAGTDRKWMLDEDVATPVPDRYPWLRQDGGSTARADVLSDKLDKDSNSPSTREFRAKAIEGAGVGDVMSFGPDFSSRYRVVEMPYGKKTLVRITDQPEGSQSGNRDLGLPAKGTKSVTIEDIRRALAEGEGTQVTAGKGISSDVVSSPVSGDLGLGRIDLYQFPDPMATIKGLLGDAGKRQVQEYPETSLLSKKQYYITPLPSKEEISQEPRREISRWYYPAKQDRPREDR